MIALLIFLVELAFLFFSSLFLMSELTQKIYRVVKSKKIAINIIFFIFLPGIIIHELSHALFAAFLFVPMGRISIYPEIKDGNINFGKLEVYKTGLIKKFLIGIAPIITGLSLIFLIFFALIQGPNTFSIPNVSLALYNLILIYLLFTIANTMFSSKKDLEETWGFIAIFILGVFALGFFGLTEQSFLSNLIPFLSIINWYLLLLLLLNFILYFGARVFARD